MGLARKTVVLLPLNPSAAQRAFRDPFGNLSRLSCHGRDSRVAFCMATGRDGPQRPPKDAEGDQFGLRGMTCVGDAIGARNARRPIGPVPEGP